MKVCVLLSGGMDSVAALYEAIGQHEVSTCLSFDYGAKHNACEIPFAKLHAEQTKRKTQNRALARRTRQRQLAHQK